MMKIFSVYATAKFNYKYLFGSDGVLIIKSNKEANINIVFDYMVKNKISTFLELDHQRQMKCKYESGLSIEWFYKKWGDDQLNHWEDIGNLIKEG